MRCNNNFLFDKKEIREFRKLSNKRFYTYIYYSLKSFFCFKFKESKRYFNKAFSLAKNKTRNNYPKDIIKNNKKVAVYTALFGDADTIKSIRYKNPRCDYYIFTDQQVPRDSGWTKMEWSFSDYIASNNRMKNRYLKTHPHLLFPDYDYSIYLDSVFIINLDIFHLMARVGEKSLGLFEHHAGVKSAYEEAERIKRIGIASSKSVDKQMEKYKNEGFPNKFGFYENGIIVRKHNDQKCVKVMETWWSEIVNETIRDQLSFTYSLWKNNLSRNDVACLGLTFWIEPVVEGVGHRKKV